MIWFNDKPPTGGCLKHTSIKKPRKDPENYRVGDHFHAVIPGWPGTHEGLIGKIGGEYCVVALIIRSHIDRNVLFSNLWLLDNQHRRD
jgi:hypothetical protein